MFLESKSYAVRIMILKIIVTEHNIEIKILKYFMKKKHNLNGP